jgi:Zn-dependent protease with chaperone function
VTREEFDKLIQKLEKVSHQNPRLYAGRLIGLVALAYAYLLLVLVGSLALCGLMIVMVFYVPVTIKLALIGLIAFGGVFLAVLRGLWVKLEPPKGLPLTREQAPKLFGLLDELRKALDCRPFHRVLIVAEVNAGVVQIPRLGVFGWHRNYLVLGLPLMLILGPEEFKAVLAHEFAHSSRGHGQFGNWIYRVRRTWAQIFEQMARRRTRWGAVLFKFLHWFWPVFNGHAFVLARANEYEADACSVRLAGADAAANALIRTRVDGSLITEKFWPGVFSRANREPEPPGNVMIELQQTVQHGPPASDVERWVREAFAMETNNHDTHPCLKDRLRAIGRLPPEWNAGKLPGLPPPPPESAAEFYLGEPAGDIARKMSADWRQSMATQWKTRYDHAQKIAADLAAMEKPAEAPPTATQIWEKAHRLVELDGDGAAITVLEQVVAMEPKHPGANFILGRHCLQTGDPRGVDLIETAIASDPSLTGTGCNLLYSHFNRTGQREKLRPLEHRVDAFQKLNALARQERALISAKDTFLAPGLTPQQIADLTKTFRAEPDIGTAAVVQKRLAHFPANPCFVIGLKVKVGWWKVRSSKANKALVQRLVKQVHLPGPATLFVSEKNLKTLGAKVFQTPEAFVYRRGE